VPYRRLLDMCRQEDGFGPFATLLARLGSRQIRGLGSLGGNLGTASPIGDALPPLIALGATVRVASLRGARELPVEEFLLGYRRNALAPDEVVVSVRLPRPAATDVLVCDKVSKRHDQDIATVGAAMFLRMERGVVAEARLAFGGMGPKAARAPGAEAALLGRPLTQAAVEAAAEALAGDFAPLSDWRGSAEYRRMAAQGVLRRLFWRATEPGLPVEVTALEDVP
jgi:xanthine dehydrogenase small subunit